MFQLRIPGPTPCPEKILQAVSKPMINHRGKEFCRLLGSITERMKLALGITKNDVLTIPTSGTGGLEAVVASFLIPGEKVIATSIGNFGDLFGKIAEGYGSRVFYLRKPWGKALHPDDLEREIRRYPDAKVILITFNETSTGVTNDLQKLAAVAKRHGKLVLVDAVSALSAIPCDIEGWELDAVVSASQKGWMVPPGLAIITVSERAWKVYERKVARSYYFDLGRVKEFLKKGQTPCTPPIPIYFGLDFALDMLLEEGMESVFSRHQRVAGHFRSRLHEIGAGLFPDRSIASDTVTAITFDEGIDCRDLAERLLKKMDIEVGGGMGEFAGKMLRIGHLGFVTEGDMDNVIEGVKAVR